MHSVEFITVITCTLENETAWLWLSKVTEDEADREGEHFCAAALLDPQVPLLAAARVGLYSAEFRCKAVG